MHDILNVEENGRVRLRINILHFVNFSGVLVHLLRDVLTKYPVSINVINTRRSGRNVHLLRRTNNNNLNRPTLLTSHYRDEDPRSANISRNVIRRITNNVRSLLRRSQVKANGLRQVNRHHIHHVMIRAMNSTIACTRRHLNLNLQYNRNLTMRARLAGRRHAMTFLHRRDTTTLFVIGINTLMIIRLAIVNHPNTALTKCPRLRTCMPAKNRTSLKL